MRVFRFGEVNELVEGKGLRVFFEQQSLLYLGNALLIIEVFVLNELDYFRQLIQLLIFLLFLLIFASRTNYVVLSEAKQIALSKSILSGANINSVHQFMQPLLGFHSIKEKEMAFPVLLQPLEQGGVTENPSEIRDLELESPFLDGEELQLHL